MPPTVCDVIVVDDDPDFADSLVDLLEEETYRAMAFPTPEAAFEWLLLELREGWRSWFGARPTAAPHPIPSASTEPIKAAGT